MLRFFLLKKSVIKNFVDNDQLKQFYISILFWRI